MEGKISQRSAAGKMKTKGSRLIWALSQFIITTSPLHASYKAWVADTLRLP